MNKISHTTLFKMNPDTVYTRIDDEAVIMSVHNDDLYSANPVATELWELLEKKSCTIPMMHDYLMQYFDVDAAVCLQDVENLMETLLKEKLLIATDTLS